MRSQDFNRYVTLKIEQHKSALCRARHAREKNRADLHVYYLKQCAYIRYVLQKDLATTH